MHHSRFCPSPRAFALSLSLLTAAAGALSLSPRLAAQDPGRSAASAPDSGGNTLNNDAALAAGADSSLSGAASVGDSAGDSGGGGRGDANAAGAAPNGDDSAIGRGGVADPDPAVGVDTRGRADAAATRSGRTTRRRPIRPGNPLVIGSTPRGNGPVSPAGDLSSNRLAPPAPTTAPRDYTRNTDPSAPVGGRQARPLPLFGYDFFQPARQIIILRRRALVPPRRVPAPRRRTNGTRRNTSGAQTGGYPPQNAYNPNESQNYSSSGGTGGQGDQNTDYAAGAALGAAALGGRRGADTSGGYGQNDYGQSGYGQNDYGQGDASSGTSDSGSGGMSGAGDSGSGDTAGSDPYAAPQGRRGGAYGSDDASQAGDTSNSADGYGSADGVVPQYTPRRRPSARPDDPYSNDPYSDAGGSNSGGSGADAQTGASGGDSQFPGDDALVSSGGRAAGPVNAVSGEIADPIASLYRDVVSSLPPNYQLQPGDRLSVRVGALTLTPRDVSATVDPQGGISVAGVGRVSVAGRTITDAETALRRQLERLYRNVDVSISLSQLRTIQVTVTGAAFAPGTYSVPASATAFNVLNAAGGPTANGSLRDIRIARSGRTVAVLDLYPLLGASSAGTGARGGDVGLRAGDNLYIPARLSRVSVRGEVRQQAVYELKPGETLRDVLSYSGGIKPSGVDQTVHIDTYNGTDRILKDISLRDRAAVAREPVFDGDNVEIASIRAILTNRVSVEGAVNQPGPYALTAGMRVLGLLERARGPLLDAYTDRAELVRRNNDNTTTLVPISLRSAQEDPSARDNVLLKRDDQLLVYSRQQVSYLGRRQVTVRGAVQRPGLYTQSDNMRVSDLLLQTGGPLPDAYLSRAVLLHQRGDGSYGYEYVNLNAALQNDPAEDRPIRDNDVLAVYRVGEAHFTPDHTVKVLGDVVAPGLYPRGEKMTLSDLLKLSGAFKPGGGTRVSVAHARRPVSEPATQVASRNTSATAPASDSAAFDSQGVLSSGTNLTLKDGDVVAVQGDGGLQDHPSVVTVTGLVGRPGPIFIRRGMRLSDAIRQAGGLRPEAFPQGAEFTRTTDALITTGQSNLAQIISQMSDLLNLSQYQRERAKASLALIDAAGAAASGAGAGGGLAVPGLGGQSAPVANPNVGSLVDSLRTINPVSQGRILTPSQLQPNGSVAVRLAEALRRPGGTEDVILKDGDTLVVPETPTTVQVIGAVISPRGVVFRAGESIDYYIQRAGDYTPDAARDRIEVIHAGGGLIPASKAGALEPGDLILVPTKVLAEKVGRSGGGFSAFFQGLVGSAITLKVLSSVFGL